MAGRPEEPDSQSISIAQLLRILRDRKWVIIALTLVGLAAGAAHFLQATPQYRATAMILLETASLDRALFGTQVFDVNDGSRALTSAANLIKLDQVAQEVRQELGSRRSLSSLKQMITTKPNSSANTVEIRGEGPNADEVALVANSFARQFILYRQRADRAVLANARAELEAQLESMTPGDLASTRGQTLSQKVEELTVLESMQTGGWEVVQEAVVPPTPFNLHPLRDAGVGLVLGLALGLMLASLLNLLDRRIKDEERFERELGAPVIARIPMVGWRWRRAKRRAPVSVGFQEQSANTLEAFRMLRSNLKYFEVGRNINSVLLTSSLPNEGKSVTAINLSLSLAMSGARVVLLEADLRRPVLSFYLGLDGRRGFTDLLAGTSTVNDVAQIVEVTRFLPERNGGNAGVKGNGHRDRMSAARDLVCVPAGPIPPNPAELLAMSRTGEVLRELRAICDYIVVDAAPLLLVSDALEISKEVDGVLLVARWGLTRVDDARRTRRSLERVGVKPLGLVVTGMAGEESRYRRYGGYYGEA